MAPAMSLSRATGRPTAGLISSRRTSTARRTVASQATSDDRPNAALLTLSAGALLAQSAVVDPAAAAQLNAAPDQGVLTASQITPSHSNKYSSTTAPSVVAEVADLNADVRDTSKAYRDPAGSIQQDNFADKVKSGPSLGSKDLGDSVKSGFKDIKKKATNAVSDLPTPAVGDLAAGSGASKNYRDPAGAVQQDKFADKVKSGPSLGTKDLGDSVKSGLKDAKKKATKAFSALPTSAVGDLADLNTDVRGDSNSYRDPAGAVQQDNFADKVKSGPSLGTKDLGDSVKSGLKDIKKKATDAVSSVPAPAVGDLAAGSGASKNYRDPAGSIQQDKFADKVKSGPSLGTKDLGDSVKSGLKDAKKKATKAFSALPTPAVGDLADLNADVRGDSKSYRDPAGAVQQDNFADKVKSGPSLGSKDLGDSVKSGLKDIKKKATNAVSDLPTPAVGDLAAGSGASKDYRDPAGAVQQDNFADKVKSGPSFGTKDLGDSVKSGLKDAKRKATKAISALPTPAVGDLADLNADVRDLSKNYRDPAGSFQQDKFADKVKSGPSLGSKDLGDSVKSGFKDIKKKATNAVSDLPTPAVGDLAAGSGASKNYRDPAGAVQQDNFADKVKSGPSLGTKDLGDSVKSGLKDIKKKATSAVSDLPTPAVGDLAAGSGTSKNYRDPAGAVQQDNFADKVKSGPSLGTKNLGDSVKSGLKDIKNKATDAVSTLPTSAVGDLADLNTDVRGDSNSYRDPAGAVQQDKFADKVKSAPSLGNKDLGDSVSDLGDSVKSSLQDIKQKAKDAVSALPTSAVGDLADLNTDVRGDSNSYRDPAGAVQQDNLADKVKSAPSLGNKNLGDSVSDLGDSVKSSLQDIKQKAKDAVGALPTPVGDLADLNGDVRGDSKSYRDPAGAVQQDNFADKVKGGPSLGTKNLGDSVKSGLKDVQRKATNAIN